MYPLLFKNIVFHFAILYIAISCSQKNSADEKDLSSVDTITSNKQKKLKLDNKNAQLTFNKIGGALINFSFKEKGINPFTWKMKSSQMPENNRKGAPFQGHFLCLGRWGSPSKGEIEKGIPHNGEPSRDPWKVLSHTKNKIKMQCHANLDNILVERNVKMDKKRAFFINREKFTNTGNFGRVYNIVQHATIGPPFLDEETIINTNAYKGFNQKTGIDSLEKNTFKWPYGKNGDKKVNLKKTNNSENYCVSFIFPDSADLGWVSAYNNKKGLLLGYIWKTSKYPWLNVWQQFNDGEPTAKGLEFGTTGLGKSYHKLLMNDTHFFGQPSYSYIDAGKTQTKSYACFLYSIPKNFKGVSSIKINKGQIVIIENRTNKKWKINNEMSSFF